MAHLIPASSLINVIKSCSGRTVFRPQGDYQPQFICLLGAGASKSSNVMLASEMTEEFKKQFNLQHAPSTVDQEKWYSHDTAYSELFERLYPESSLRRDYIERVLEYASPSWGYLYLVNLLKQNIFNTIFTTNFDDLLNEACYLFSSDVRPICCAHDSSIRSVRLSNRRPKIIKLHGDFLYDNIKNTLSELESLDQNMRDKFKQFAREFGIVVIGYSGNDRSIMDVLDAMMGSDDNFPHGVYWCVRSTESICARVDRLTRFKKFHLVEIDGFDQFMCELHEALNGDANPVIQNPYFAIGRRMTALVNDLSGTSALESHPTIKRDIINLGKSVRDQSTLRSIPVPYYCLAKEAARLGNVAEAREKVLQHLRDESSTFGGKFKAIELGFELAKNDVKNGFTDELLMAIRTCGLYDFFPSEFHRIAIKLIGDKELILALRLVEMSNDIFKQRGLQIDCEYCCINRAQILHRLKRRLSPELRKELVRITRFGRDPRERFGARVALKRFAAAVNGLIGDSDQLTSSDVVGLLQWPLVQLLPKTQLKRLDELKTSLALKEEEKASAKRGSEK